MVGLENDLQMLFSQPCRKRFAHFLGSGVFFFFFFFAVVFFKKNYKYIKIIYFLFLHDLKIFKKLILKKSSFFFFKFQMCFLAASSIQRLD
jgi:hypothetical protein